MEATAVLLVLVAALLHAGWNALVKLSGDHLLLLAVLHANSAIIALLFVPVLPLPAPASWPYLAASVVLHVGYLLFLVGAYRHGDLGHVYPLARGSAPLLVTIVSLTILGEGLSAQTLAAVLIIAFGILALAFHGGVSVLKEREAVAYALGTGVFIAAYTVVDGVGARLAGSPHAYAAWLFTLDGLCFIVLVILWRGRALYTTWRADWQGALLGGAMSLAAYWLVIWAMTLGPIAPVSALRETSVIFAPIIGALFLKESFARRRVAAAVVVVVGVVLLRV